MANGKNNKMMLWLGIGGGALLLLNCCCLGGVGGWFFFLRSSPPEKTMLGKWKGDAEMIRKKATDKAAGDLVAGLAESMQFEIKDGGTITFTFGGNTKKGQWKLVSSTGDTAVLDVKDEGASEWTRTEITVVDSNHLKVVDKKDKGKEEPLYLKRI
jgi:hypothetical protein